MNNWPVISHTELSETLSLTEYTTHGFWLYDETRGMNLAVRAKSRDAAFVDALTYYQLRLAEVEEVHADLSAKINAFVSQLSDD